MTILMTQASVAVGSMVAISGYFGITSRFNLRRFLLLYFTFALLFSIRQEFSV
jgi:hypothetical protein